MDKVHFWNTRTEKEHFYTDEEFEFLMSVDKWRAEKPGRRVPSCIDCLNIAKKIGYRKIAVACLLLLVILGCSMFTKQSKCDKWPCSQQEKWQECKKLGVPYRP